MNAVEREWMARRVAGAIVRNVNVTWDRGRDWGRFSRRQRAYWGLADRLGIASGVHRYLRMMRASSPSSVGAVAFVRGLV